MAGNNSPSSLSWKSPLEVLRTRVGNSEFNFPGRKLSYSCTSHGGEVDEAVRLCRDSVRESVDKDLDLQVDTLLRAGRPIENIRAGKARGEKTDRNFLLGLYFPKAFPRIEQWQSTRYPGNISD